MAADGQVAQDLRRNSLTWRPSSWLQMPMIEGGILEAAGQSHRSSVVGPQTHRLPFRVMWGITLLTALGMALINFMTVLSIEFFVRLKFNAMQAAIQHANGGTGSGIFTMTMFSMVYAFIGVCLIQYVAPTCNGSGLPENKCYLNGSSMPGLFSKRTLAIRVITSILANAAGFPVGREGPFVTIGSNLAFLISKLMAKPYTKEWLDFTGEGNTRALFVDEQRFAHATRIACAVGGACAMAAIFNAPFGGLLYMFEEITSVSWPLELSFRVFVATMCCSLLSYGLVSLIGSSMEEFVIYAQSPSDKKWEVRDIPVFIIVAALLGVITSLHTRLLLLVGTMRQRALQRWLRLRRPRLIAGTVGYGGLCALVSTLVSLLLGTCTKQGNSELQYVRFNCAEDEYNPVASLLVTTSHSSVKLIFSGNNAGEIRSGNSMVAFLAYFFLNIGLTGLPVPGGAFTATMLLGGLFGRSIGGFFRDLGIVHTVSGVYAVVGSAAMLCGFKQMTLSAVLIVVECVNDLSLAPVVMLGVTVAIAVNWTINERGFDEEQIVRKNLPLLEGEAPHELDNLAALNLLDPLPEEAILRPEADIAAVRRALELENAVRVCFFPIRDVGGPCLGLVSRQHLEAALEAACGRNEYPLAEGSRRGNANFEEQDDPESSIGVQRIISSNIERGDVLHLHRIMDRWPFTIVEDMPAPRLYALFAKAGERAACVTSIHGEYRGVISRAGLIEKIRQHHAREAS